LPPRGPALGIPIGLVVFAQRPGFAIVTHHRHAADDPSFCFIIPVVMLFRVGDVTALIATVALLHRAGGALTPITASGRCRMNCWKRHVGLHQVAALPLQLSRRHA
jgi:hypothetical protein